MWRFTSFRSVRSGWVQTYSGPSITESHSCLATRSNEFLKAALLSLSNLVPNLAMTKTDSFCEEKSPFKQRFTKLIRKLNTSNRIPQQTSLHAIDKLGGANIPYKCSNIIMMTIVDTKNKSGHPSVINVSTQCSLYQKRKDCERRPSKLQHFFVPSN